MRARYSLAFAAASTAIAILAWACGSFTDGETPLDPDSGTSPDGSISGDGGQPGDGGATDGGDGGDATTGVRTLAPPCPRPAAPKCAPLSQCPRKLLYSPPQPGVEYPFGIATDSDYVYWTTVENELTGDSAYDGAGTARIMRVDRRGALATPPSEATVIATGQRRTIAITMAGDFVYWAAIVDGQARLRRVSRACSANCTVQDLPSVALGGAAVFQIKAINDQTLVVANDNGTITVVKIIAGGNAVVNGSGSTSDYPALAVTSKECFATGGLTPAIDWISGGTTSTPQRFATLPDAGDSGLSVGISPITTDCKDVYGWRGQGTAWKVDGDSGVATQLGASIGLGATFEMTADQAYLWLAVPDGAGVYAIAIADGQAQPVVGGNVHRLALDDLGVYYGDHEHTTGGAIWMVETR